MVDFNKISEAVQNTIKEIAKTEGSKKKIDTQRECMQLSQFLAGNHQNMNVHEKDYVVGLMIEYQEKAFEENVTDATKDLVNDIAKRTYDKKKIDSDEEAFALATLLRNSRGDLNRADLEYIKQILIKNGYGHYLEMFNPPQGRGRATAPTTPNTQPEEKKNLPPTQVKDSETEAGKSNENIDTKAAVGEPQIDNQAPVNQQPVKKAPKKKPIEEEKTEPANPTKSEGTPVNEEPKRATMFDKAVISEKGRTEGMVIAQKILEEFDSLVVDNDKIKELIGEINSENAFTVLTAVKKGVEKGVNEKTLVDTSDPFNKLTLGESYDIAQSLLKQAASMGLGLTPEYKSLAEEADRIGVILDHDRKADPSKDEARTIDKKISKLLSLMNQVVYETDRDGSYESRDEKPENRLVKLKVGAEFLKKFAKNNEQLTKNN